MIYEEIYNLLQTYCFGSMIEVGSNAELVCMLCATIGTIFVVALPFVLVLKVIKLIMGR